MTSSQPRLPYPSDLSDARWALMEPTLTAWRAERQKTSLNLGGKVTDLREVMNAILFLNRTGVPWRYLPHDSRRIPPHSATSAPGVPTTPSRDSASTCTGWSVNRQDAPPSPPPA